MPAADIATAVRLRAEHDATLPLIEQIRSVADELFSQTAISNRCGCYWADWKVNGLYAVLRLHNAQEEEGAFSLVPDAAASNTT